ncbi:hypothetical protein [Myxosarcina sp. GI1]|uniref:hypothetical protein n=1 Tax=Myxosarcina sp. GI1 TaxID=1541065 RepID=UPI000563A818|nr:hypothetical protein [Myxosarcina sp. GI1]
MTAPEQLQGVELIDCAKANAESGLSVAAKQCGYGDDTEAFKQNLVRACQKIGVEIEQLSDLVDNDKLPAEQARSTISPDTTSEL